MKKREEAVRIENFVLNYFDKHEDRIRRFYTEQTGYVLPTFLTNMEKKDMFDRFIFWRLFDKHFRQRAIQDRIDGTASGACVELKYNTYGVDEKTCIIIDKSKIDVMKDEDRVVILYFDFENEIIYARQFLVKDIKKYEPKQKGGKANNEDCEESNKWEYFVPHTEAEDLHIWRKSEKKS